MNIPPNKYALLAMLAVINFTHIVDSMLIMPLGDTFVKEFAISPSQYSLLVSAYAIAAALSSIVGIFILDKFDRKKALLVLYFGFAAGTLFCGICNTYALLVIARFFTGIFGGMVGALALAIVSDIFPFKERGFAMGALYAAFSAASAFGIPIGIYLAAKATWQTPFMAIGLLGIIISILIFALFPNMNGHIASVSKKINLKSIKADIIDDPNQRTALIAGFILVLAHFMIIPFISPYMMRNIGFSQEDVSFQFFLGGVATLITSPIIGKLTDKLGVIKVFTVIMILSFIPTLIITNLKPLPFALAYVITTLFFVFGSGRMIAPNAIITAAAPVATRGSFMSLKSSLQQFAIALSGIISGSIMKIGTDGKYHNYSYVGLLSVVFGLFTFYYINKIKVASGN